MTYSDFTLEAAKSKLGLKIKQQQLFSQVEPLPVPPWLQEALEKGVPLGLSSEKARSEFVVVPVLLTGRDVTNQGYYIYSGQRLDVAPELGLTGECDFILAHTAPSPLLQAPIITLVEAKKNDIEIGLGQCIAQMAGAKLFNEKEGTPLEQVYGCVTTGEAWQFLKLAGDTVIIDRARYYLDNVGSILAIFKLITDLY